MESRSSSVAMSSLMRSLMATASLRCSIASSVCPVRAAKHPALKCAMTLSGCFATTTSCFASAVGGERFRGLFRGGLVRFARGSADDEDRRAVLGRRRLSLRGGPNLHHGAGRRFDDLAVDLERRRTLDDDVELLLARLSEQGLVVLADDLDAAGRAKRRDAERRDAEAAADVEALPPVVGCPRCDPRC